MSQLSGVTQTLRLSSLFEGRSQRSSLICYAFELPNPLRIRWTIREVRRRSLLQSVVRSEGNLDWQAQFDIATRTMCTLREGV